MADILIPGMKMPKHCLECPLRAFDGYDYCCPFTGIDSLSIGRQDNCPLHELPEHGDLIDRDAFRDENEYYLNREFINPKYEDTLDDLLKDAPVVIPSSKEGNA